MSGQLKSNAKHLYLGIRVHFSDPIFLVPEKESSYKTLPLLVLHYFVCFFLEKKSESKFVPVFSSNLKKKETTKGQLFLDIVTFGTTDVFL